MTPIGGAKKKSPSPCSLQPKEAAVEPKPAKVNPKERKPPQHFHGDDLIETLRGIAAGRIPPRGEGPRMAPRQAKRMTQQQALDLLRDYKMTPEQRALVRGLLLKIVPQEGLSAQTPRELFENLFRGLTEQVNPYLEEFSKRERSAFAANFNREQFTTTLNVLMKSLMDSRQGKGGLTRLDVEELRLKHMPYETYVPGPRARRRTEE